MDMDGHNTLTDSSVEDDGDPWYLKHLPGRSDDMLGHVAGAVCMFFFGFGMLAISLIRAKNMPDRESFAERFIPEKDVVFLRRAGCILVAGALAFASYFLWDKDPGYTPSLLTHTTFGFTYLPIGLSALLESYKRLPFDTHRIGLVMTLCIQGLMWYSHGVMKGLPVDQTLHLYLAYVVFLHVIVLVYSILHPESVKAYLAGWAFYILEGIWVTMTGLYESWIDLHMHDLAALMGLFALSIFAGLILVYALVVARPEEKEQNYRDHVQMLRLIRTEDTEDFSSYEDD